MTEFEQPPTQHIEQLHTRRARLMRIINRYTEVLLEDDEDACNFPRLQQQGYRADLAAQITAHELTVARIDREIAALSQKPISLPSDNDHWPDEPPEEEDDVAYDYR